MVVVFRPPSGHDGAVKTRMLPDNGSHTRRLFKTLHDLSVARSPIERDVLFSAVVLYGR